MLELLMGAGATQSELELRLQKCKRCPQLVARVGDEATFVFESVVEPREHVVERDGETADFVVARRCGQLRRLARGHSLGAPAQCLNRAQGTGREGIAAAASRKQSEREEDQELVPQVVERLGTRGERPSHDRDLTVVSGQSEHSPLAAAPMQLELLVQPQATCARGEQLAPIEHGGLPGRHECQQAAAVSVELRERRSTVRVGVDAVRAQLVSGLPEERLVDRPQQLVGHPVVDE